MGCVPGPHILISEVFQGLGNDRVIHTTPLKLETDEVLSFPLPCQGLRKQLGETGIIQVLHVATTRQNTINNLRIILILGQLRTQLGNRMVPNREELDSLL